MHPLLVAVATFGTGATDAALVVLMHVNAVPGARERRLSRAIAAIGYVRSVLGVQ